MKRDLKEPVSPDDVGAFLKAKIPAGKDICPRCGVNEWRVVSDEEDQEIAGLSIFDRNLVQVGLYAAVVLNCGNCGFIAMHAKQRIIDWLDEADR